MTQLSREEFRELRQAIQSAYRSRDDLKIVVREELGLLLNEVAAESASQRVTVANLIEWAEAKGELEPLLLGLQGDTQNARLEAVCAPLLVEGEASVEVEARVEEKAALRLTTIGEQTVTLNDRGEVIDRKAITVRYFTERVGDVGIDMVPIRGGTYLRGSPKSEAGQLYDDRERPQFRVTVPNFWIGRYAVTQAQWRAVAQLQKVDRDLEAEPSYFKGDRRPVEQVSWGDAQEFCARLSRATGVTYRLPSEAEWEHACRAETTTPFAFGTTLTTDVANFAGKNSTYAGAPPGKYRGETMNVGSFPPNVWGLYDMHGNVWEWCEDAWKTNYNSVPVDSSPYIDISTESRLLRGGSWLNFPRRCRSAVRYYDERDIRKNHIGFRVVFDVPRAL